jgi:predicted porin
MLKQGQLLAGALAAAAVTFSGMAAAEAKGSVYGDIRIGYSHVDENGGNTYGPQNELHDNGSYWGIKASTSIGGVTAFGTYERHLDTNDVFTSNSSIPTGGTDLVRQAFLGVTGGFGTVSAGTMETAYSKAARQFDPFYGTGVGDPISLFITPAVYGLTGAVVPVFGGGQSFGGSVMTMPFSGGAFVKNQVAYSTPSLGGVTVSLSYFNDDDNVKTTGASEDPDYGIGVDYRAGGISVGLHHLRIRSHDDPASTSANFGYITGFIGPGLEIDTTVLAAGYAADRFGVGLTAERIDLDAPGVSAQDQVQLAGWFGVMQGTRVAATVGYMSNFLGAIDGVGATVGVFHDIVENFTVHFAGYHVDLKGGAGVSDNYGLTLGASYKFDLGVMSGK